MKIGNTKLKLENGNDYIPLVINWLLSHLA